MILGIVPKRVFLRALWEFRSLSTQMSNLSASNLRFTKTVYRYRISFSIFVYIPGTLNNNCSTDVWWNTHLPFKDLESSDWNNRLNSWMARVLLCSAAISTPPPKMLKVWIVEAKSPKTDKSTESPWCPHSSLVRSKKRCLFGSGGWTEVVREYAPYTQIVKVVVLGRSSQFFSVVDHHG